MTRWSNWSGQVTCEPARVVAARDVGEVVAAVTAATRDGLRVKAVGSGHSFSPVATTDGVQLRLDALDRVRSVDAATGLVTVEAGITVHDLNLALAGHGLALRNLGDIDRQTISGAVATGTHGTGVGFGSISTQVRGLELVLADGSVVTTGETAGPASVRGLVPSRAVRRLLDVGRVGLGALGVVTAVTLQCVPAYVLEQVEEPMPLDRVIEELDALVDGHDHFEVFWFPHSPVAMTKRTRRLPADAPLHPRPEWQRRLGEDLLENTVFGGLMRAGAAAPRTIPAITRFAARVQSGGRVTDVSHRVFASRRDVRFHEGEHAVPRSAMGEVLREIRDWVPRGGVPVSFPFEVRFSAADDIALSPAYERTSGWVAFHQYHRVPFAPLCAAMESILGAHGSRPHWGKHHTLDAERLRARYPRFDDFVAVRDAVDPGRVFGNAHLERVLG